MSDNNNSNKLSCAKCSNINTYKLTNEGQDDDGFSLENIVLRYSTDRSPFGGSEEDYYDGAWRERSQGGSLCRTETIESTI